MKIGDLAHATGTKVETIRFYEGEGLLPKPARTTASTSRPISTVCRSSSVRVISASHSLRYVSFCALPTTLGDRAQRWMR